MKSRLKLFNVSSLIFISKSQFESLAVWPRSLWLGFWYRKNSVYRWRLFELLIWNTFECNHAIVIIWICCIVELSGCCNSDFSYQLTVFQSNLLLGRAVLPNDLVESLPSPFLYPFEALMKFFIGVWLSCMLHNLKKLRTSWSSDSFIL